MPDCLPCLRELDEAHKYDTDKLGRSGSPHDYTAAYERHLRAYRSRPIVFWEVGAGRGGSLAMWGDYFPLATIVGIDREPPAAGYVPQPNCLWHVGDATRSQTVRELVLRYGAPEVVIDDGSHRSGDIAATFDLVFPIVRSLYVVEDMGTQYEKIHGRTYLTGEPFHERVKRICDDLAMNASPERSGAVSVCWEAGQVYVYKAPTGDTTGES